MTWLLFVLHYFVLVIGGLALSLLILGFGIAGVCFYWLMKYDDAGIKDDADYAGADPYLSNSARSATPAAFPKSARISDMQEPMGY